MRLDPAQIELGNHIDTKAHKVVREQRFFQTNRLFQSRFVICSPKFSTHAVSLPFQAHLFVDSPTAVGQGLAEGVR